MKNQLVFRAFASTDQAVCLALFDANCPAFFAPGERADYAEFLDSCPPGYEVCLVNDQVVGALGLTGTDTARRSLSWILLHPQFQGRGIGLAAITRVTILARSTGIQTVDIATSHKTAGFFARLGAVTVHTIQNGWGLGLHRVDMLLPIQRALEMADTQKESTTP